LLAPVAFLAIISAFALERSLRRGADAAPFLWCVAFYLLVLASLAISVWPYIVPWRATLWEVASPPRTQLFVLVGVAFILPLVLGYTANAYYVFRGKVSEVERY
jgi:cytochrome d ubiquinol oxidase subunit II